MDKDTIVNKNPSLMRLNAGIIRPSGCPSVFQFGGIAVILQVDSAEARTVLFRLGLLILPMCLWNMIFLAVE